LRLGGRNDKVFNYDMKNYLALDLGAGSGRAIVGRIADGRIETEEILRFENTPVQLGNTIYWDFPALFNNIKKGIATAEKKGYVLNGIAVDTWGVDFGLLDSAGRLLSNPVTYRDARTAGMTEYISTEELYGATGIQTMEINTVFQLLAMKRQGDPTLAIADKLLFIPDLINYFLTGGVAANEYTIASTSQLLDARTKQWDSRIFEKLGLPLGLMGRIVFPGEVIGNYGTAKVFAVGSHDTASAIGAIPAQGDDWAFLSSGTWSLLGVTTKEPVLSDETFTNEGGIDGDILFMRNITGLWLLQQLIAEWGTTDSYDELLSAVAAVTPFQSIVDSDDPSFSNPAKMSDAIRDYCARTGQRIPQTKGEFVRCVLESLAMKYYFVMERLKKTAGRRVEKLYVVGGGGQNAMLNQFTADVLNMEVVVGLTEATAIGNIMQQAIADGVVRDWQAGHEIIRNSFNFERFQPKEHDKWRSMIERTHLRHCEGY